SEASREEVHELVTTVVDENIGVVAGALGPTKKGGKIMLNDVLFPPALVARARIVVLGPLAQCQPRSGLAAGRCRGSIRGTFRHLGRFGSTRTEPRLRHGYRVYSGGLASPTGRHSG